MKKISVILLSIFFCIFVYFSYIFFEYNYRQNQNNQLIKFCSVRDNKECQSRMFELILPNLLLYSAHIKGKELELIRLDPSRIDTKVAIEKADMLFGYGIYNSASYEEMFSTLYDKYSYAFDCGVNSFKTNSEKCIFKSECIATDKYLIFDHLNTKKMQISSGQVHTLSQKIKELNAEDKKIFVKMDIGDSTFEVIPELIENSENITGLNILIEINSAKKIIKYIPLLKALNKKFILINTNTPIAETNALYDTINTKYYKGALNGGCIYLSYVNKNLVDNYGIRLCQNSDKIYRNKKIGRMHNNKIIPFRDISIWVVLREKLKFILGEKE